MASIIRKSLNETRNAKVKPMKVIALAIFIFALLPMKEITILLEKSKI